MTAENTMAMAAIGLIAVQLHAAGLVRKESKIALRVKYAEYADGRRIEIHSDEYLEMQSYAAEEVKAYARAKLDEYNLKRKLDRAVRAYKEA